MSSSDQRCPQCGALLRDDAAWCTLCFADLRPPAPAEAAPAEAAAAPHAEPIDPLSAPLEQVLAELGVPVASAQAGAPAPQVPAAGPAVPSAPVEPVAAQAPAGPGARVEPELDEAALAALAAVGLDVNRVAPNTPQRAAPDLDSIDDPDLMLALLRSQGQDPLLAKVGNRLDTKGAQAMLIAGGASALALLMVVVFTVLGLILH